MRTIKTGNILFDIFWKEYPPRINSAGVMEKKRKGLALKWFETHKPSEEQVYDMVAWVKKDNELRAKSGDHFYSPPPDAIVWLNQKRWMDEIGIEVTKTQRREAHRSKAVYGNNVQSLIEQWQGVIKEWPIQKLVNHKGFMSGRRYPEFRDWAIKERPDLEGARPDPVAKKPVKLEPVGFGCEIVQKVDTAADLPPPKPEINPLVEQFIKDYDLFT